MDKDKIIALAREAGCHASVITGAVCFNPDVLERFAALVAAHERRKCKQEMCLMEEHCAELILIEREACAKVCEELETHGYPNNRELKCAAAIRARSTKE